MTLTLKDLDMMVEGILAESSCVTIDEAALAARVPDIRRFQKSFTAELAKKGVKAPSAKQLAIALAVNSANYCFWEGSANHYPAGGSSNLLWEAAQQASAAFDQPAAMLQDFYQRVDRLAFPLRERRMPMIKEVVEGFPAHQAEILAAFHEGASLPDLVDYIRLMFPGYAEDRFIKRVSLFLELLHEECGFGRHVEYLPIPADYQVPKVLNVWGVLRYTPELTEKITKGVILPSGGEEELAIRAGTVQVGTILCREYGIAPHIADRFLWSQRKNPAYARPYHLTVTTDY